MFFRWKFLSHKTAILNESAGSGCRMFSENLSRGTENGIRDGLFLQAGGVDKGRIDLQKFQGQKWPDFIASGVEVLGGKNFHSLFLLFSNRVHILFS